MRQVVTDRVRGAMLGAALGDSLGSGVRERSVAELSSQFPSGAVDRLLPVFGRVGGATDGTQLALFTADAFLRAQNRQIANQPVDMPASIHRSFLRWRQTQQSDAPPPSPDGWLLAQEALYRRCTLGTTLVRALETGLVGRIEKPLNNHNDAAPCFRMVPVAVAALDPFRLGMHVCAATHGHADAMLASGALALFLRRLMLGDQLARAAEVVLTELEHHEGSSTVAAGIDAALDTADLGAGGPSVMERFGDARRAESALAMGLYAAAVAEEFGAGIGAAAIHDGDSRASAGIAGALLGAMRGASSISESMVGALELGSIVSEVTDDLIAHFGEVKFTPSEADWTRYPG